MDVDQNAPIAFNLAAIAESETRFVWRATIGFSPYDWELGQEESFYFHGYTPPRRLQLGQESEQIL
jgi:hypothetical protein